jgi:hypothetical protein
VHTHAQESTPDAGPPTAAAPAEPAAPAAPAAESSLVEGLGLRIQRDPRPEPTPDRAGLAKVFRLHGWDDPAPPTSRLLAMCAWAAALGVVGMAVAVRGLMAIMGGTAPTWYESALVGAGLVGIGLTVGAFMSIQRRRLPWFMLAAATLPLIGAVVLTIQAL